jgi:hypothetical protein
MDYKILFPILEAGFLFWTDEPKLKICMVVKVLRGVIFWTGGFHVYS